MESPLTLEDLACMAAEQMACPVLIVETVNRGGQHLYTRAFQCFGPAVVDALIEGDRAVIPFKDVSSLREAAKQFFDQLSASLLEVRLTGISRYGRLFRKETFDFPEAKERMLSF